jgi:ubiquinone/menaquinone biosynthesis C-methylase UbiE
VTAPLTERPRGGPPAGYIMEHAGEVRRLELKTDHQATEQQLSWAGLRPGMTAIDVGCGSGAVTRAMIGSCRASRAVGVDLSPERIAAARALARHGGLPVEFATGDVTRLPLGDASFDFAWSRFVFEYLADPAAALAEMTRVSQPGGIVAVADLDGQITGFHPLEPSLQRGLDRCLSALAATGFDPNVGRKLYSLFCAAGLKDITVDVRPYQVYAGGIPASEWHNWQAKLRTITDLLCTRTGDIAYWHWFRDAMGIRLRRPDIFYHSTLVIARGRR